MVRARDRLAPERADDLRRGVDGGDLEVVPGGPEQVDGDGPHVEHAGDLLDDLLEGAGQILVEGARLHLDQPAQGPESGARLVVHRVHCSHPLRRVSPRRTDRAYRRKVTRTGSGGELRRTGRHRRPW